MFKKILLVLVVLIGATIGYYYSDISKALNTATGFTAKNLCSGHYNSGYRLERFMREALIPVNPVFEYVSFEHDEKRKLIRTSIFGMKSRTAQYRDGLGCTLLGVDQEFLTGNIKTLVSYLNDPASPWPEGNGLAPEKDYINYQALQQSIDDAFAETETTGMRQTKAIMVVHKGELIAERYANPITSSTPSLSWSMAKSITNMLIGALVQDNKLDINAAAPIEAWQNDARSDITLDMLLRMSSGLAFDENYSINTDATLMLSNETSASEYALNMPLQHPVDTYWSYSSGTSNILARITYETIGGNLQDKYNYIQDALFEPLGIRSATMETDGSNVFIGSSYFYASPHDYAKLGLLLLQDGYWKGQQVLPTGWVDYSKKPTPTALNREYGAHFWLNSAPRNNSWRPPWPDAPSDAYFMSGYQGQFLIMIPSEELVVLRLGYTYPGTNAGINELLSGIISALNNQ